MLDLEQFSGDFRGTTKNYLLFNGHMLSRVLYKPVARFLRPMFRRKISLP
jgi:hypothetical protein